uniref:NADPH adrenodoxin oxidoreductase n=1 Tax=Arundo donax TaxID=35708 RepID=A0A0A9E277_ARUDO
MQTQTFLKPKISRSSFAVQAACTGPRRPTKYTFLIVLPRRVSNA